MAPHAGCGSECKDHKSPEELKVSPHDDTVNNKYRDAATITNDALKAVIKAAVNGASARELCKLGDSFIVEATSKLHKGKNSYKGIAMPTCVSVNNCACHFSPLNSDPDVILKDGDVVKIDLGTHFDGYIATAAHTVVVGASEQNKVTGKVANALVAANKCLEAAMRMVKPTGQYDSHAVNETMMKIAKYYDVTLVENMVSHQLQQDEIHGSKGIVQNPSDEQRQHVAKVSFEPYDVFALDILVSTGSGKLKLKDTRTTVYKKSTEQQYALKMKNSRAFYSEANSKFGSMPFTIRAMDDEVKARVGVLECTNHGIMEPHHVMYEKDGEFVVQFKYTVFILPGGVSKIAGLPFDYNTVTCEKEIVDEEISQLLKTGLKIKKVKAAQ
uniref:Proliferation-associated protein 2G4 (inferred by orthology to a human protein) n=1 Tax=Strongyloides venezuelensis TaxID=75913 RepID=A0A0K0FEK4_STRVS